MSTPSDCMDDPLKIFVSRRITDLCRRNDKSGYWLSKTADISESNISSYVSCKTLPTLPLVKRICDAFGITLSQFFSQDQAGMKLTDQNQASLKLTFQKQSATDLAEQKLTGSELTDQALAVSNLTVQALAVSDLTDQALAVSELTDQALAVSDLTDQALAVARLWGELNFKDRESVIRHMQALRHMEEEEESSTDKPEVM